MNLLSKNQFWDWFEKNHGEFLHPYAKPEDEVNYWTKELDARLKEYHKSLNFFIDWRKEHSTLVITVDAQRKYFKAVDDLVDNAPVIPGWSIKALIPPGAIDFIVEERIKWAGVDPEEFRFSFLKPKTNRADLTVFHPLYTPENDIPIYELVDQIILNLLGERSFGNNIRSIDVTHISNAEPDKLEKLEVLHRLFSGGSVITSDGNLVRMNRRKR